MQNKMLFARQGGFRRNCDDPKSWHGFGGFGYPRYLNKGMYGGYRSHYNYNLPNLPLYQIPNIPPIFTINPGTKEFLKWIVILLIISISFIMSYESII
jgi:hypothetical protein